MHGRPSRPTRPPGVTVLRLASHTSSSRGKSPLYDPNPDSGHSKSTGSDALSSVFLRPARRPPRASASPPSRGHQWPDSDTGVTRSPHFVDRVRAATQHYGHCPSHGYTQGTHRSTPEEHGFSDVFLGGDIRMPQRRRWAHGQRRPPSVHSSRYERRLRSQLAKWCYSLFYG